MKYILPLALALALIFLVILGIVMRLIGVEISINEHDITLIWVHSPIRNTTPPHFKEPNIDPHHPIF